MNVNINVVSCTGRNDIQENKIHLIISQQNYKLFNFYKSKISLTLHHKIYIMKKLMTLLFISVFAMSMNAQDYTIKSDPNAGVFEFETETVDYGTIAHKSDGVRSFKFKNVGKSPIIITKVKGTCGCTVPSKPNRPIMPGETAEIGVKYATNRVGKISKSVIVTSNATRPRITLRIVGEVLKPVKQGGLEKEKSLMSAN